MLQRGVGTMDSEEGVSQFTAAVLGCCSMLQCAAVCCSVLQCAADE